jgi:DNA-binding transcriptional ArsR family regulator
MAKSKAVVDTSPITESDEVFELAAELFRVMSAPMRLRIISSLCNGEKNVGELLREIDTTQPNMSQHLHTLYQSGVLGKRREGVQIFYRIINDNVVTLCRAVCTQIAIEGDPRSIGASLKTGNSCRSSSSTRKVGLANPPSPATWPPSAPARVCARW